MPLVPTEPARRRGLFGIGLAVLSAAAFTISTVATVWSYEGGGEPLAAITVRFAGAIVVLVGVLYLLRIPFMLPPRQRLFSLALGCLLSIQSYCLYNSFAHIPVGLTFAIFYIYPVLVSMIAIAIGQDRMTPAIAVALVAAFSGLLMVFNVTGARMDPFGAGLALGAAGAWSLVAVISGQLMREQDPRPLTLHMQVTAGAIYIVICLIDGDVALPATVKGWIGFIALPVLYALSTVCFFAAIALIGSIRATLVMNLEPVFTIAAGFAILGQVLSRWQLAGAALVIAAVFAVRLKAPASRAGSARSDGKAR